MKDYYKILEVTPGATPQDIKTSFRKLALRYHPDRTNNNRLDEAKFKEVQEAYRTLSNPVRKRDYDQKINRATPNPGRHAPPAITPQSILLSLRKISTKLKSYDTARIDQKSLYSIVRSYLSSYNIVVLKEHDDLRVNRLINEEVLYLSRYMKYQHAEKISAQLKIIAQRDTDTLKRIQAFIDKKKRFSFWDDYKIFIVLFIAFLLCFVIYLAGE